MKIDISQVPKLLDANPKISFKITLCTDREIKQVPAKEIILTHNENDPDSINLIIMIDKSRITI